MWIKYLGEKIYSSLEIRDLKPGEKRDMDQDIANRMIKKYPDWFKSCPLGGLQAKVTRKTKPIIKLKSEEVFLEVVKE